MDVHLVVRGGNAERGQEGNVDHKGLIGQLPGFANGVAKVFFRLIITGGEIAHPTRIRDSGTEFRFTEPHHGPADNGIFDAEHFGNGCLEHYFSSPVA